MYREHYGTQLCGCLRKRVDDVSVVNRLPFWRCCKTAVNNLKASRSSSHIPTKLKVELPAFPPPPNIQSMLLEGRALYHSASGVGWDSPQVYHLKNRQLLLIFISNLAASLYKATKGWKFESWWVQYLIIVNLLMCDISFILQYIFSRLYNQSCSYVDHCCIENVVLIKFPLCFKMLFIS